MSGVNSSIRSLPPGFNTRYISARAFSGWVILRSPNDSVQASKCAFGKGSCSPLPHIQLSLSRWPLSQALSRPTFSISKLISQTVTCPSLPGFLCNADIAISPDPPARSSSSGTGYSSSELTSLRFQWRCKPPLMRSFIRS